MEDKFRRISHRKRSLFCSIPAAALAMGFSAVNCQGYTEQSFNDLSGTYSVCSGWLCFTDGFCITERLIWAGTD